MNFYLISMKCFKQFGPLCVTIMGNDMREQTDIWLCQTVNTAYIIAVFLHNYILWSKCTVHATQQNTNSTSTTKAGSLVHRHNGFSKYCSKCNHKMKSPTADSRLRPWAYYCLEKKSLLFWTSGLMVSLPGFQPAGQTSPCLSVN